MILKIEYIKLLLDFLCKPCIKYDPNFLKIKNIINLIALRIRFKSKLRKFKILRDIKLNNPKL